MRIYVAPLQGIYSGTLPTQPYIRNKCRRQVQSQREPILDQRVNSRKEVVYHGQEAHPAQRNGASGGPAHPGWSNKAPSDMQWLNLKGIAT